MIIDKNYPRPQFARKDWIDLNGYWNFLFDDADIGENQLFYKHFPESLSINVPFTYETIASGIHDESVHNVLWYSRHFDLHTINKKTTILHFEGSDYSTKVWINGVLVGINKGGYHRFSFDISDVVTLGDNIVTVRIEDSLSKEQARGKQRFKNESFACWYIQTSGIWKTVWIEQLPEYSINSAKCSTDNTNGRINLNITFNKIPDNSVLSFEAEIIRNSKTTSLAMHQVNNSVLSFDMGVNPGGDIYLWSPDLPNLYDIVYRLYKDGNLIDEVHSYFGIRNISFDHTFKINNYSTYLKMVLDQGYWKETHLSPPSYDALLRDVNIAKEYGFNGIRIHQKIEDERFLYICDHLGVLVWSEMPSFYSYTNSSKEQFKDEWIKIVNQFCNHPSIIAWVPFNESWGIDNIKHNVDQQAFVDSIYEITKQIDNSRPIISNDGWEHVQSDLLTIHDYEQDFSVLESHYNVENVISNTVKYNDGHKILAEGYHYANQPIIMSEYGGIALSSEKEGWWYGNQALDEFDLVDRYVKLTSVIKNNNVFCGYCYTQLTDVQQEKNGLVDEDRNHKVNSDLLKTICKINSQ